MTVTLHDLGEGDYQAWRPLWDAYCDFYQTEIAPWVTARTWARLIDPQVPIQGRVARSGGRVVGFAHHLTHPSTWHDGPVCYLEDLFVAPEARGTGAGRALIDDLISICERRGWEQLYWITASGNETARRLYDFYDKADGTVRYRLNL